MTDSFLKIDYSLRPAKYAERRMLCDIFRRLSAFDPLERYRYVGFGSVWFSDFTLFHRALGIKDMLSIEASNHSKDRFTANRPFEIDIDFRTSAEVLPSMGYERRQFIWLDYDDPISPGMLQDVATVAMRARSGTALIVSVQCVRAPEMAEFERARKEDPNTATPEERFVARFGHDKFSAEIDRDDLAGWPFGQLSREMFYAEIDKALAIRRMSREDNDMHFKKICSFRYQDGAKMTTFAGIFYSDKESECLDACNFSALDFLQPGKEAVFVPTPKLTPREFRHLESQLPLRPGKILDLGHIPQSEAKDFPAIYRYLPTFAVLES